LATETVWTQIIVDPWNVETMVYVKNRCCQLVMFNLSHALSATNTMPLIKMMWHLWN